MSTLPGRDAWRDAGFTGQDDEIVNLVDEVAEPVAPSDGSSEYRPGVARPDLDGSADEADVVDQAAVAVLDEDDA